MIYWVYILYSESTGMYYKGQTVNLEDRLMRHNSGYEKSTGKGKPWKLVWCTRKSDRSSALRLERQLKNLTRKKLEEFIISHMEDVAGTDAP